MRGSGVKRFGRLRDHSKQQARRVLQQSIEMQVVMIMDGGLVLRQAGHG